MSIDINSKFLYYYSIELATANQGGKMKNILNITMLISLFVVFISGFLLKVYPGMALGICHALSAFILLGSAVAHMVKNGLFKRKSK